MKNKIALLHKEAEEKRAMIEAKRGEDLLKAEELAAKYRATGTAPKKILGIFWSSKYQVCIDTDWELHFVKFVQLDFFFLLDYICVIIYFRTIYCLLLRVHSNVFPVYIASGQN